MSGRATLNGRSSLDAGPFFLETADSLLLDRTVGRLSIRWFARACSATWNRRCFERTGATVVLVTHDLVEAGRFADRVCVMHAGRIVQQGPFAEILERPSDDFVREFVRSQVVTA